MLKPFMISKQSLNLTTTISKQFLPYLITESLELNKAMITTWKQWLAKIKNYIQDDFCKKVNAFFYENFYFTAF